MKAGKQHDQQSVKWHLCKFIGLCVTLLSGSELLANPDETQKDSAGSELYLRWNCDTATERDGKRYITDSVRNVSLEIGSGITFREGPAGVKALWYDGTTGGWAIGKFPTDVVPQNTDFGEYSFCCWLYRPSDFSACKTYVENSNFYPRILICNDGYIKYQIDFSGVACTYAGGNGIVAESISPIMRKNDEWCHLAACVHRVFDESEQKNKSYTTFYLNGVKVKDSCTSLFVNQLLGGCSIVLGADKEGGTRCWYGGIGDVRFYRGALTDAEVKAVYCGLSEVSAGADRTVGSGKVRLFGTVAENARQVFWGGTYATKWTQVSGPSKADIVNPMNLETAVNLPEKGTYVFRFAAGANGCESTDDVMVIYDDPIGKTAPTVTVVSEAASMSIPATIKLTATASGAGVLSYRWLKSSGPGGVWFEPPDADVTRVTFSTEGTYELACAVSDGENETVGFVEVAVAAGSTLPPPGVYIPFDFLGDANVKNPNLVRTIYDAARGVFQASLGTQMMLVPGGILGDRLHTADSFADGDVYFTSFGKVPRSNKRTISAWIKYQNPSIANLQHCHPFDFAGGDLAFQVEDRETFLLQMNLYDQNDKYLIFYLTDAAKTLGYSLVNRWFHLCITVDAENGFTMQSVADYPIDRVKFYVDGVLMKTAYNADSNALKNGYPYTYVPKTWTSVTLTFGNESANRYFPGDIDEFRVYNGVIFTADQVKRLAMDVNPELRNRRPIAEAVAPVGSVKVERRTALALDGTVFDDGHPAGGTLSGKWVVVSDETGGANVTDDSLTGGKFIGSKSGSCRLAVEVSDGFFSARSEPVDIEVEKSGSFIIMR